ncbi:MAG: RagB/SusD family nutrient uptake outer membrane protein [Dysgonamonadaceae bacterium]|nr:RagB/SusD family nutrient uptake outer membrane protein [Dysgonamonadaceae bacterium]
MKNLIKIIATFFLFGLISCDFLDVVPNDTPTLDHAFSNRSVTEKFLRTCYSHLPDPMHPIYYPTWFTSRDEFDYGFESRVRAAVSGLISQGLQNTNDPYLNYWSGRQGGSPLYIGIRDCNIFLENIHIPRDIMEEERERWISEVKFLKAYYHYFLLSLYGPIVLIKDNLPLSASPEEVMVYREPFDECVDYIVELIDEAVPGLPPVLPDPAAEQGRFSQVIALSVKAKLLSLAASPLFNGNTDYKGWIDNRGKQLISDVYDKSKWETAAIAIKEALDLCHENGYALYEFNKYAGGPQTFNMNDTVATMMTIRKAITEDQDRNPGVIWATQEESAGNKGGVSSGTLTDIMRYLFPNLYTTDQPSYVGYYYASWHMGELFYSNNGVFIEEDKNFDYSNKYGLRRATPGDKHESYIATGETSINLHFDREPRFYANLGIDRGYYELSTTTKNGGATFSPFIKLRDGEVKSGDANVGYQCKKIIPFEASASQGDQNKFYTAYDYRFPLIRLADLYLLYSEALNEMKDQPDNEVYEWIDRVREKAGLKGVVESWTTYSKNPDRPMTQTGMREIIRRERLIELAFEGQRFWDLRRWKIAEQYWSLPPTKWNYSRNIEDTYKPIIYSQDKREVTFRDYLYPLRDYDIRINQNLEQTYGW